MTAAAALRALAYLRLGFIPVWLFPRFTATVFGLHPEQRPGMTMLSRLIATREATLGASLLLANRADADLVPPTQVDIVAIASVADIVGIGMLWRGKDIGARTAGLGLTTIVAQLTLASIYRRARSLEQSETDRAA